MSQFLEALKFVLKWEGGFVNHPADPGGATNKGITQLTYDAWSKEQGKPLARVEHMQDQEVQAIYRTKYWDIVGCEEMPWPLCLAVFDTAVNLGVRRASHLLEDAKESCQLPASHPEPTEVRLTRALITLREQYYRTRPPEKQKVFLRGWLNRCTALRKECGVHE